MILPTRRLWTPGKHSGRRPRGFLFAPGRKGDGTDTDSCCPGSPTCTIFADDFSIDDLTANWTQQAGSWSIGSGVLTTASSNAILLENCAVPERRHVSRPHHPGEPQGVRRQRYPNHLQLQRRQLQLRRDRVERKQHLRLDQNQCWGNHRHIGGQELFERISVSVQSVRAGRCCRGQPRCRRQQCLSDRWSGRLDHDGLRTWNRINLGHALV